MSVAMLCPTSRRSSMCDCQRRDVRMQHHDVPERLAFPRCDVESNVATYQRGIFFNVATLNNLIGFCVIVF